MKAQLNEVQKLQKLAGILKESRLNEDEQGMPSYSPGSSDTSDWDSGLDIEIKSALDDKLKGEVIKKLQNIGIDAKFKTGKKTGKTYLFIPFAGDDANVESVLSKLGIEYN